MQRAHVGRGRTEQEERLTLKQGVGVAGDAWRRRRAGWVLSISDVDWERGRPWYTTRGEWEAMRYIRSIIVVPVPHVDHPRRCVGFLAVSSTHVYLGCPSHLIDPADPVEKGRAVKDLADSLTRLATTHVSALIT